MNEGLLSTEASGQGVDGLMPAPARLRQAREAAGLHIAALAIALKVPVKKLEALEAGRYDELPDLTFARALASSACRHLKIDPAQVLDQIPSPQQPPLGGGDRVTSDVFKPGATFGGASIGWGWLKRPAAGLSLLALLAAAAVAWLPAPSQWPVVEGWMASISERPSGDAEVASPVSPVEPALPSLESAVVLPGAADTQAKTGGESAESGTEQEIPAEPTPVGVAGRLLVLTASAASWVAVIDGNGRLQVQRVLKAGERLDFTASPPYSVVLGRADAVQVQVRGEPFDVTPFARNSVARFEVK